MEATRRKVWDEEKAIKALRLMACAERSGCECERRALAAASVRLFFSSMGIERRSSAGGSYGRETVDPPAMLGREAQRPT